MVKTRPTAALLCVYTDCTLAHCLPVVGNIKKEAADKTG